MLVVKFEDLNELVKMTASKYFKSIQMEFDDLYQELWLKIVEVSPDNLAHAAKILKNHAIDIYRKKRTERQSIGQVDIDSEAAQIYITNTMVDENSIRSKKFEIMLKEVLDTLPERDRIYVITKGYLDCDLYYLKDEFDKILDTLTDEDREAIYNDNSIDGTDELITRYVFHFKNGRNSGNLRWIKYRLRESFKPLLDY